MSRPGACHGAIFLCPKKNSTLGRRHLRHENHDEHNCRKLTPDIAFHHGEKTKMVTFTAMSFITMVLGYNTNLVKRSDVPHRPTRGPWQSILRVISAAIVTAVDSWHGLIDVIQSAGSAAH